jgi:hypothetical protein
MYKKEKSMHKEFYSLNKVTFPKGIRRERHLSCFCSKRKIFKRISKLTYRAIWEMDNSPTCKKILQGLCKEKTIHYVIRTYGVKERI